MGKDKLEQRAAVLTLSVFELNKKIGEDGFYNFIFGGLEKIITIQKYVKDELGIGYELDADCSAFFDETSLKSAEEFVKKEMEQYAGG